uniref:Hyaluronoglucosaminidase n=1 Tax=Branchiostoma floridae TaxID=7739 RepID=C3Z849_BRAFL|eukprot:XP_002595351.1 hypothetical protein BRAFLDRAFT_124938 [Branchiostoma floridae]
MICNLLFLKVRANYDREGYNYCSHMGCEKIIISATMTSDAVSDCTAAAYPKYSLTPTETVPMPSFLSLANDCAGCGAPEPIIHDDNLKFLEVTIQAAGKEEMELGNRPFIEGSYGWDSATGSGGRGIHVHVIDETSAAVVDWQRFDTQADESSSRRLASFIDQIPSGKIVALQVYESASGQLKATTRQKIRELGSIEVDALSFRNPWVFVGVKGDPSAAVEQRIPYVDTQTTGRASIAATFDAFFGSYDVTATSEWLGGRSRCTFSVDRAGGGDYVINLKDDVSSWQPGDHIVLASTDYNMEQAEEFELLPCQECSSHQVKISGQARYTHFGEISDDVDLRGEVGLLTRNIKFQGEVEDSCYGDNFCQYFSYDTYGGHLKILQGYKNVHLSGIELTRMGQQVVGSYPVHFHMAGDVDEVGGYSRPTYVRELSIHHCFSRCLTIHGTHGLLVQDTVGYDTLGHCFFLEDGVEQRNVLDHNLGLVTRAGTLLPTDRDSNMCRSMRDGVYGNHVPTDSECRYKPHQNSDLLQPRVPAMIEGLISFKNTDHGSWVRGGDIWFNKCANFPIRGLEVYDGPILAENCTFKKYASAPEYNRWSGAIGFKLQNSWQTAPNNNLTGIKFEDVQTRAFFGGRYLPFFDTYDKDGDKTQIFHDVDGSTTGHPDTHVVGQDNYLVRNAGCLARPEWRAYVCSGKYAQLFIHASIPGNLVMSMVRDEYPDQPYTLKGPTPQGANGVQKYQPPVMLEKSYTIHWNRRAPQQIIIYPINFNSGDWLRLGLCYPPGTIFRVTYQLENRMEHAIVHDEEVIPVSSLNAVEGGDGKMFYFEESTGLLFLKVRANYDREGYSYCSHMGCERIIISATMTSDAVSDCTAAAYPKYSLTPAETIPMSNFLSMANDCTGCGAPVDGVRYDDRYRGFRIIAVDARNGSVTHQMTFNTHGQPEADAAMATFIRRDIPNNSIVLVATRDSSSGYARECLTALKEIGAQEPVQTDNRGNFAMVGFKGTVWPTWIQQVNLPSTQGPAQIYTKIPLMA